MIFDKFFSLTIFGLKNAIITIFDCFRQFDNVDNFYNFSPAWGALLRQAVPPWPLEGLPILLFCDQLYFSLCKSSYFQVSIAQQWLLSDMRGPSRRAAPPCTAGWRSSVAPVWTAAVPNGPPPISPCLGATLVKVAPPASSGPAKVDANQTAWASCECRVVGEKCCCQMICKTNLLVISEFESQWGSLIQCWYTFSFPLEWFHVSTHCSDLRNVLEPFAAYPKV